MDHHMDFSSSILMYRDFSTSIPMAVVLFYTPLMTVVVHVGLLHYPDGCGGLFTTLMAVKVSPTTPMAVKVDTVVQRAEGPRERKKKEMKKNHVRIQTMSFLLLLLSTWFGSNLFVLCTLYLRLPTSENKQFLL